MRDAPSCPPPPNTHRKNRGLVQRPAPTENLGWQHNFTSHQQKTAMHQKQAESVRRHSPQEETKGQHPLARREPTCLGSSPALTRAPIQPEGPCQRECQTGSQNEPPMQKGTCRPHPRMLRRKKEPLPDTWESDPPLLTDASNKESSNQTGTLRRQQ